MNEALEGLHCRVCTPILLPVNAVWIVLMVCFSSCRIDFLIAELVKLLSISFIKLCHFIGYMLENGLDYDLIMLYIACLSNDEEQLYIMNAFL